ncbi:MAG: tetratricopeptide repeat protein [Chloroflexi bacterium SZAS-1]|nr:tetratricopeptide repeat protein [Chloroflexi bacterium SZAS-1]
MRLSAIKATLLCLAMALAAASAYGLWRAYTAAQVPPLATQRLAAAQRPVDTTDQLIWDYQQRVRQNPDDVQSYAVLGAAYLQKARDTGDPTFYGKAQAVIDTALKHEPQNVDALIGAGTLANARHQFHDALRLGEQARALNPTVPRVYGVIADAQTELGMYDQAIQTLQTMIDMRPDLSSFSRVSYARELHGDLDGAIAMMQAAVQAGGPASENSAWVRVQLGNLFFAQGDLAAAEQQYQGTLTLLPDYVYAQAGLARVRAAQGQVRAAVALYQQSIARMPLPEFVIGLGELYQADGQPAEATKQYELVQAMQQLFKANGVDTDLELALFDADHGADAGATVALARAAYARRPSIKAADTLGWALLRAGQVDEARRYANEALRLGTRDALMLYHAGMIAQAQGDAAQARAWLNAALTLNPHFSPLFAPQARQALAALRTASAVQEEVE